MHLSGRHTMNFIQRSGFKDWQTVPMPLFDNGVDCSAQATDLSLGRGMRMREAFCIVRSFSGSCVVSLTKCTNGLFVIEQFARFR